MKKRLTLSGASRPDGASTGPQRSRSGDLLRKVVQSNTLTADDVAARLCLQPAAVEQLLDGTRVMSLPHQLGFATLLLERVPSLARSAYTLRAQALAAIAFSEHRTEAHSQPPGRWRPLKLL